LKTLNPILDRIVVVCEPSESVSDGGIVLLDNAREMHLHPTRNATVVAVGPGKLNKKGILIPLTVKVGDRVQFSGVAGVSVSGKEGKKAVNEETLITEDDIYFIYGES